MSDYYVYVYIDPRNLEEFYYGKGCGSRKNVHMDDGGNSSKAKRITAIRKAGETPIIRVIARGLEEEQAYWIEATLLWKLGKFTTNQVAGHFQDKFRPRDTFHRELPGFDFQNRLYYFNVGERRYRKWEDYRKYKFISAGQGPRWRDAILGFRPGDVFAAYLKGRGYVGIGRIKEQARRINEVIIKGKPLITLCPYMASNCKSPEKSEYVARVEWIKDLPQQEAKMKWKSGIYTTTHVRASLDGQPKTVSFLSKAFGVEFDEVLD